MLYKLDGYIYTDEFDPEFPGYKKKGKYVPLHSYIYWLNSGLVAEKGKTAIHHKDGNKENNEFYNLELITLSEHATHHWNGLQSKEIDYKRRNSLSGVLFGFKGAHLDKRVKAGNKAWEWRINYNNYTTRFGFFIDPLSPEIIYKFTLNEICGD
jgi:hypothetical protein